MKLHIEKALIQDAINTVIRAVPSKSTIPALEGLLLDAQSESLTVTAFNTQVGIRTRYAAEIEQEGRIILNARLLSEIIRKMPEDTVTLDCDDKLGTKIQCGKASYNIMAISADEYPELPELGEANTMELPEATLKSMIAETIFAVSTNEARPIHMGELFEINGGKLHVVACDGFRMAVRAENVDCGDAKFVVPGTTLSEVERLCGDGTTPVSISVGERHVLFTIGQTEIISRRLEGEFLDWQNALPKKQPIKIKVNARELVQSIERVSVVVNEKLKSPMCCTIGNNAISLSAKTAIGAASDKCKMEGDGKDLEIGFNGRYLSDALKYAPENDVCMSFDSAITPTLIRSLDPSGKYIYMVLPVRLKKD